MIHRFDMTVGPVSYRIGSDWPGPVAALRRLYADYPVYDVPPHYTVRLEASQPWRRMIRPSVAIRGDFILPEALPLPLGHGLLAAEMGMNLQLALGERRFLLLHAGCVERGGRALILTGDSGSGKSTLSALLGERGWRFLGDEFVLIDPRSGACVPFPRPASLKNASIAVLEAEVPATRFGPLLTRTPKGDVRHLAPRPDHIAAMTQSADPVAIVFPRFGHDTAVRSVPPSEVFVRMTQASTNYVALAEAGFDALTRLVRTCRAVAIDYPDTGSGIALIEDIAAAL